MEACFLLNSTRDTLMHHASIKQRQGHHEGKCSSADPYPGLFPHIDTSCRKPLGSKQLRGLWAGRGVGGLDLRDVNPRL